MSGRSEAFSRKESSAALLRGLSGSDRLGGQPRQQFRLAGVRVADVGCRASGLRALPHPFGWKLGTCIVHEKLVLGVQHGGGGRKSPAFRSPGATNR